MQDNSWYEKGELPPVGIECEKAFTSTKNQWSRIFVAGKTKIGEIIYEIVDCPNRELIGDLKTADSNYKIRGSWTGEAYAFRPIKSDREKAIEAAVDAMKDTPYYPASVKKLAGNLYDAGLLRLPEDK